MGREKCRSRSSLNKKERDEEKESVGCMSGVRHFFDLHQIQFCMQPQQEESVQASKTTDSFDQGIEAPRNSLELVVDSTALSFSTPPSSALEHIPAIGIQLHPLQPKSLEKDLSSSETSGSTHGSKTPNLVARLMGLDVLPDHEISSPRTSSSPMGSSHSHPSRISSVHERRDVILPVNGSTKYDPGIRSLPGTPRISSARRSDVVGPRLSLQLNKENDDTTDFNYYIRSAAREAFSASSPVLIKSAPRKMTKQTREGKFNDESKSPSTYAREIMKQVKDSVSRRVGLDITNMSSNNNSRSRNESISPTNKTIRKITNKSNSTRSRSEEELKQTNTSIPSCSPRLKFLEAKTKRLVMENKDHPISSTSINFPKPSSPKPSTTLSPSPPLPTPSNYRDPPKPKSKPLPLRSTAKCKKATCERFTQRHPSSSSSQTPSRKKCKMPMQSKNNNHLLVQYPSSNVIQIQAQPVVGSLSPCASSHQQQQQQYEEEQHQKPKQPRDHRDATVTDGAELRYVAEILERTGGFSTVQVNPLDPDLFHHLERCSLHAICDGPLQHRSNRRLLFDLIDEILRQDLMAHHDSTKTHWLEGIREPPAISPKLLLSQLRSFPEVKCETKQDIEGLVGFDLMSRHAANLRWEGSESVGDSVVSELEREIVDSLVEEALLLLLVVPQDTERIADLSPSQPLRCFFEGF